MEAVEAVRVLLEALAAVEQETRLTKATARRIPAGLHGIEWFELNILLK